MEPSKQEVNVVKKCKIDGCKNKHHGKGYCKKHYMKYVLEPRIKGITCSVDGCENQIGVRFTKPQLCVMHGSRFRRHGDANKRKRDRDVASIVVILKKQEDVLNYHIENRDTWSLMCRLYYGDKCQECGWDEGSCDAHHIISASKGGRNTINNGKVICPNCHSLIHRKRTTTNPARYTEESLEELKLVFETVKALSRQRGT